MNDRLGQKMDKTIWIGLAIIVVLAAFFRIHDLDKSAFRADSLQVWNTALRHTSLSDLWGKWFDSTGLAGQMPLAVVIMQTFLFLFHLDITPFAVRLPFALMSLATVPVAFFAMRSAAGVWAGLFLALLYAVNPFAVYYGREAYFYSSAILGYTLFLWAVFQITPKLWNREVLNWKDILLIAVSILFSCYSQMTGFFVAGASAILWFGIVFWRQRNTPALKANLIRLIAVHAIMFIPFLFVPWGPREMLGYMGNKQFQDSSREALKTRDQDIVGTLITAATQFSWGQNTLGVVLIFCGLAGAAYLAFRRDYLFVVVPLYMFVAQVCFFLLAMKATPVFGESRYISGTFPFYLAMLTAGLFALIRLLPDRTGSVSLRKVAAGGVTALAILPCVYPSYLITQLTGQPTPYFEVVRYIDSHLPQNTPVLVDRWFEPWNELEVHKSTNVIFTFTIPNEPPDVFVKYNWRETAKQFFEKYPDAAYLEIAKSYWSMPQIGPWDWPKTYFARHMAFTNEAGVKLREMGLASRGDFYDPFKSRLIVELYYNTREDVLAMAQKAGKPWLIYYGEGWGYTKLWRQMNDFRDWRVLTNRAVLEIYNFKSGPVNVQVAIHGVAVNGSKRVTAGPQLQTTFPAGQMFDWNMGTVTLQPGRNAIELLDPLWSGGAALLVDSVSVQG